MRASPGRGWKEAVYGSRHHLHPGLISPAILAKYDAVDINVYGANLFHTKLLIRELDLENYLFNTDPYEFSPKERMEIAASLRREMMEIFSGCNVY